MRSLFQRAFDGAAAALALLALLLWPVSHICTGEVSLYEQTGDPSLLIHFALGRGALSYHVFFARGRASNAPVGANTEQRLMHWDGGGRSSEWTGRREAASKYDDSYGIIPFSESATYLVLLPLVWAAARFYQLVAPNRANAQCQSCGYDLRATPGRCPECGSQPGTWKLNAYAYSLGRFLSRHRKRDAAARSRKTGAGKRNRVRGQNR